MNTEKIVAVVTGASRGVGKGVALGLGEAGATVYITGRTVEDGKSAEGLPGSIHQTAEEVNKLGGKGIPIQCDHRNDAEVEKVFKEILSKEKQIDILVNNVWGGYEFMAEKKGETYVFTFIEPFWNQPLWRWDSMFQAGVRANYAASQFIAPLMIEQKRGLIVNISFWAAQKYSGNLAYGVAKAAVDKMSEYMAHELKPHKVAVVSLYPGLVRTESVMRNAKYFDLTNSESPQFIGRVVSALAGDPDIMKKSGKVLIAAAEAIEYGVKDIDGRQPRPLTLESV